MAFVAKIEGLGTFNVSIGASGPVGPAGPTGPTGPTGVVTANSPLSYNESNGSLSINLSGYATETWVNGNGFITNSALGPYLTSATAASTYQPVGSYATTTQLTDGLATKQPVGSYATTTQLTDGLAGKANTSHTHSISQVTGLSDALDGKQPSGSYATTTQLTDGLAGKANTTHTHDASAIVTGVIDIARIPIIPSQVQVVSTQNSIANLTAGEQAQITGAGVLVTTTDGNRWAYSGTGSKTSEASYVKVADITPDWTEIANKPFFGTASGSDITDFAPAGWNPFDQTLNTAGNVEFASVKTDAIQIKSLNANLNFTVYNDTGAGTYYTSYFNAYGGGLVLSPNSTGITFPDATVQTTAYTGGGDFLPLAGGTMTGNITFGESGQYIGKGTFDTSRGGGYGLSLVCSVGYEFNWQAGWLITTEQNSTTPRPLYLDSVAGTTLRVWDEANSTGTEVSHTEITFPDSTTQTTAAVFYDQSLNSTDNVFFNQVSVEASPTLLTNIGGGEITLYKSGDSLQITGEEIQFADDTIQTTAGLSPATAASTYFPIPNGDTTQYIAGDGSLITFPTLATANKLTAVVYNQTGATITKGKVVYINGSHGNQPTVALAQANAESTSAGTYGFVEANISNNSSGTIVIAGVAENLATNDFEDGDKIYLSPTVAGGWTTTKPYAPNHMVYLGVVTRAHTTQGTIQLRIANGFELDELHDVQAQSPALNDGLFYDTADSQWKTKSIATVLGYTPADNAALANYATLGSSNTFTSTQAYNLNTSTVGFRISQAGTGEAFRVEDIATPDTTPFVITADGRVGIQTTTVGTNSLAVSGTSLFTVASGSGVPLTIQNNGTGNSFVVNDVASDTSPFIIANDGKVLIGTTTASSSLVTVSGSLSSTNLVLTGVGSKITFQDLTEQTSAGISAADVASTYLTQSSASSTYYPLTNPSNFIDSSNARLVELPSVINKPWIAAWNVDNESWESNEHKDFLILLDDGESGHYIDVKRPPSAGVGSARMLVSTDSGTTGTQYTATGVLLPNGSSMLVGSFDSLTGGVGGISLNCTVGYELNWQAGRLSSSYNGGANVVNIISDSHIEFGNNSLGVKFGDGTVQTTAASGGGGGIATPTDPNINWVATWHTDLAGGGAWATSELTSGNGVLARNGGHAIDFSLGAPKIRVTQDDFTTWTELNNQGIVFPDGTSMTTASYGLATPTDTSKNWIATWHAESWISTETISRGDLVSNGSHAIDFTAFEPATNLPAIRVTQDGFTTSTDITPSGIKFPDGSLQTTAAGGGNLNVVIDSGSWGVADYFASGNDYLVGTSGGNISLDNLTVGQKIYVINVGGSDVSVGATSGNLLRLGDATVTTSLDILTSEAFMFVCIASGEYHGIKLM